MFTTQSMSSTQLSRVAAERYAQLSAVAERRVEGHADRPTWRLVRLVRSKLA